ncbi:MAG: EutP/PduV family microcompartment system protein [Eubacterium sp.]
MKKMILVGRSECGKTTLKQALRGKKIHYEKTQYINHFDVLIDTPGEYAETNKLARALALYSYEADVVALLLNATEPYSLYPPCVAPVANRPVIGVVTQIDHPMANVEQAAEWLKLTGADPIFKISSYTGEGIWQLIEYLREDGDELPWDKKEDIEYQRDIISTKNEVQAFKNTENVN